MHSAAGPLAFPCITTLFLSIFGVGDGTGGVHTSITHLPHLPPFTTLRPCSYDPYGYDYTYYKGKKGGPKLHSVDGMTMKKGQRQKHGGARMPSRAPLQSKAQVSSLPPPLCVYTPSPSSHLPVHPLSSFFPSPPHPCQGVAPSLPSGRCACARGRV